MSSKTLKRLSEDEVKSYRENGFIKLRNLFSKEEMAEISKEYDDLFERKKQEKGRLEAKWKGDWKLNSEDDSGNKAESVLSIHNLQLHSGVFTKILTNTGLLDALEDLIGDGVVLHHTKAHLKPPSEGAPFPAHQDYHYFPYRDDSMLAVFLHLDRTNKENGGLVVFPGSHKLGPQKNASNTDGVYYLDQSEWNVEDGKVVEADEGEVVVFSYLLVHASHPNVADRPRRMFLIQVAGSEDVPLTEQHKSPCAGMVLRGRSRQMKADLDMRHLDNQAT